MKCSGGGRVSTPEIPFDVPVAYSIGLSFWKLIVTDVTLEPLSENFIIRFFLIVAFICVFVGCANFPTSTNNYRGKPYWISHPSGTAYIGGVGYSGAHINGKAGQRELATARAIEDIAKQLDIKVDSVTSLQTLGTTGDDSFASMKLFSVQTVTGASFSAKITDVWEDASSGELYIYMRLMN